MRKTSLDLDQESTIVSVLALGGHADKQSPSTPSSPAKGLALLGKLLLAACAALVLVAVFTQGSPSWP